MSSKSYDFSSSHAWMCELDYKESWTPKNWCFWTVMLKTLESPLDCKVIQPVHPKGKQPWIFIGKTHAEAETPILWLPDVKNWVTEKDPDAGKDWSHFFNKAFAGGEGDDRGWDGGMASPIWWTGVLASSGYGQGGLACCIPWGHKELDTTERLNWNRKERMILRFYT